MKKVALWSIFRLTFNKKQSESVTEKGLGETKSPTGSEFKCQMKITKLVIIHPIIWVLLK